MPGSPFGTLFLFMLAALPACGGCSKADAGKATVSAHVERPEFSADQAFALLQQQVAFGPRIPGQPGHEKQIAWMRSWLAARADTLAVDTWSQPVEGQEPLQLTNFVARFRPELTNRVLLVTHWDTRPKADQSPEEADRDKPVPGANDAASGTAILMELADMFKKQPPPVGVDLLFVDGEDYGPGTEDMFFGSRYFAEHQPPGYHPLYGVLLDMVGDSDLGLPVEANSAQMAPDVVERVWGVAKDLGYGDVFTSNTAGAISDDHLPLNQAGIRTIDIIDFDYGPGNKYWHTPEDLPEHTSAQSLHTVGEVMAELIYRGG